MLSHSIPLCVCVCVQNQAAAHGGHLDVLTSATAESVARNTDAFALTHPYRVSVRLANGAVKTYVARRIVLAIGPAPMSRLTGDIGVALGANVVVKQTKAATPVTVNLQFPTRWWSSLGVAEGVSLRVMGEGSCLSRTEFPNTPYFRDMNVVRAAYSDGHCAAIYAEFDRLPEPARTNAAAEFVTAELRRLFPNLTIPDPIGWPW